MPDNTDTTDGADTIRQIEEANVANILAKLKAGKVISRDEQKRLTEYQERENATAGRSAAAVAGKVADSMEQAAALSGYTKEILQRAKQAGCPAFRGSRVYVDELTEWMGENGDTLPSGNDELDAINLEIAREKLRRVRHDNEVEEGRYIKREDEAQKILALGIELKSTLTKRLEEEFPDRLAMRPREEIAPLLRDLVDQLSTDFAEGTSRWSR